MTNSPLHSLQLQDLIRKRRSLKRGLSAKEDLKPLRIAVLGGSTTNELVDLWELYLLERGYAPVFHQSEYGQFFEEAVLHTSVLQAFGPDLVYVHTSHRNVLGAPGISATEDELTQAVEAEFARYKQTWTSLESALTCQIIQNNFDLPPHALLGNLDASAAGGSARFFMQLNERFAREAAGNPRLLLHDIHRESAEMGLRGWYDGERWFSYKIANTIEASAAMAESLTSIVLAVYGLARKVLVLDLDNTMWGGVIGDDGLERIQIGNETPVAEAFTAFQRYCNQLRQRGVLLAVCSKNDDAVARSGFEHPDAVVKLEDISAFRANWQPKHENIASIAAELNLGVDSFVFADDNPAERAIVSAQLPGVAVPELGNNPASYIDILQAGRHFEAVSLSQDDLARAAQYASNAQRATAVAAFADYGEYLDSLEMTAEIAPFSPIYMERIAQLTNKTNQFNLTTKRYTLAEISALAQDGKHIALYGRLSDKFGDNGLVSVVLGRMEDTDLHLDLWLMSCRVLKRDMELAMLDSVMAHARHRNADAVIGYFLPTKKNGMVADFYDRLGFAPVAESADGAKTYRLPVSTYQNQNSHIKVREEIHG